MSDVDEKKALVPIAVESPVRITGDVTEAINMAVRDVLQSFQEDGGREASKSALTFVRKGLDCLQVPFDLLLAGRDGVSFIANKVRQIPDNRRQRVQPQIAGPALEGMRYLPAGDPVFDLFAELLAKASDTSTASEVHPRFVRILKDFSPYEARIMTAVSAGWRLGELDADYCIFDATSGGLPRRAVSVKAQDFPVDFVEYSEHFRLSLALLEDLGLTSSFLSRRTIKEDLEFGNPLPRQGVTVISASLLAKSAILTTSGKAFCNVCVSEEAVTALGSQVRGDIPTLENLYGSEEPFG